MALDNAPMGVYWSSVRHDIDILYMIAPYPVWQVKASDWFAMSSQLLGTVGAVDGTSLSNEACVSQVEGALLAVEAVIMPRAAFVVHYVRSFTKPYIRLGDKEYVLISVNNDS